MNKNLTSREIKIERLKKTLPEIVKYNLEHSEELDNKEYISDTKLVYFTTKLGSVIFNPYKDITYRKEVDPFEYYNIDNLLDMLDQYDDKLEGEVEEYDMEGTLKLKLKTSLEDSMLPNKETMLSMLEEDLQDFLRESSWQIEETEIENFKVELRKK